MRSAPAAALFRLLLVLWGKLIWFGAFALFLAIVAWGEIDAEPLPGGLDVEVAVTWLLAPALALAFLAGILPSHFGDGFAESPLTRALPGLDQGFLRATLLVGGLAGIAMAGTPLSLGLGGSGAVALTALALVHFLIAALSTGIRGRNTRPANHYLLSPGRGALLALIGYGLVLYFDPSLPGQLLPALGLLALTLHGAGWLFLRWHFGRCDLGPSHG